MLEGVSLDQLRIFIAAADEGSFSAAGRRLARAQSVVSQTLANLEGQIGVKLFDRSARFPVLTDQGRALLPDARTAAGNVDLFMAQAKILAGGLEPELSVAVDVMFPDATFTGAVVAFQKEFPATVLRFDVESSAVVDPVLNRRCAVGVVGSWSLAPPQITHERLLTVRLPIVVSSQHPLATCRGPIPTSVLDEYVQLTHVDPADASRNLLASQRHARVWRLSHLGAKLAFLRAGFGFGGLPVHMLEEDFASGALVQITVEDMPPSSDDLGKVQPVYECLPGWRSSTFGISAYGKLPEQARDYLEYLEKVTGVEVGCISTGPERNQTIIRKGSRFEQLLG